MVVARLRLLSAVLVWVLVLGCTPASDTSRISTGTEQPDVRGSELPTATDDDGDGVTLDAEPQASPAAFDIPGEPAGQGFDINTTESFDGTVTLVLPARPPPTADYLPVAGHYTAGGWHWEPAVFDEKTGTFRVEADGFSFWTPFWTAARELITDAVDGMADDLTGHTDPPECSGDAPTWATITDFSTSAVHTCWHDPEGDGTPELLVKSNRGSFLVVTMPNNAADVWIEDQPDWLRPILSSVRASGLSSDRAILLPPGKSVSFGWDRPDAVPVEAHVSVYTTQATALLSATFWAIDAGFDFDSPTGSLFATATMYRQCTLDLVDIDPLDALDGQMSQDMSAPRFFRDLTKCAMEGVAQLANPEKAVGSAYDLWEEQLLNAGVNQQVLGTSLSGNLNALGRLAKVVGQVIGASKAVVKVGDVIVDAVVGLDTASVALTPQAAAAPSTPSCGNVAASPSPERVSRCLYEAWFVGDRETALDVAWPYVVDELFAFTSGIEWEFVGCEGFSCTFVEPAPGEVHGVYIEFVSAPDADGDGRLYVGRMEFHG